MTSLLLLLLLLVAVATECSPSHFKCRSGRCVLATKRCDGHLDCDDHSDEDNCGETQHFKMRLLTSTAATLQYVVQVPVARVSSGDGGDGVTSQAALSALCGSVPAVKSASKPQ